MRGVKALRESHDITLKNCDIVSPEFGWRCGNVNVCDTTLESEYPFFESSNITLEKFTLKGKYSFQYVTDSVIRDSVLNTKDSFEYSDVNADIRGSVLSVKNPHSGRIVADSVGEIISGNSVMDNNCEIVIRKQ